GIRSRGELLACVRVRCSDFSARDDSALRISYGAGNSAAFSGRWNLRHRYLFRRGLMAALLSDYTAECLNSELLCGIVLRPITNYFNEANLLRDWSYVGGALRPASVRGISAYADLVSITASFTENEMVRMSPGINQCFWGQARSLQYRLQFSFIGREGAGDTEVLVQRGSQHCSFTLKVVNRRSPFQHIVRRTCALWSKNSVGTGAAYANDVIGPLNVKVKSISMSPGIFQGFQVYAFGLELPGQSIEIVDVSALAGRRFVCCHIYGAAH